MSKNSRTFLTAAYGFDATVRRVATDGWSNQSPCEQWTAADVLNHCVEMNRMVTGFTKGIGADRPPTATGDPIADWQPTFDEMLNALDHRGALQTVAATPWGEMPVDKFLGFAWVDPLIHTWDLAMASGQQPALDAGLVDRAYVQLERAGDSLRGNGGFAAAVAPRDDMTVADRFIAISGRNPAWTPGG